MARRLRIQYPGAAYHVMSRGVLRGDVFSSDEDYARFLSCLARAQEKFRLDVFAFVLMSNHYHLFLRTREANLSRALQWLQTAYSIYYNRRHGRSGHVFEGRFKAIIVGEESYWIGLTMYIHLNPVRAGMAPDAGDYRWSSYRDYVEEQKPHEWVKSEQILRAGGDDLARQRAAYRESVLARSGRERTVLDDLKHGLILGSEKFVRWIRDRIMGRKPPARAKSEPAAKKRIRAEDARGLVMKAVAREFGVTKVSLATRKRAVVNIARDVAMHILKTHTSLTNKRIGSAFGVVSDAASVRVEKLAAGDPSLKARIDRVADSILEV
ncbi:MAG: transposase [Planctomycetota bacterium]|nr:transposase [Planctomycetota bacterium]